jgi:hypothetical protein
MMRNYYFDRWEDDDNGVDDESLVLTADDIQRALDETPGPIYDSVSAMFKAVLG